MVDVDALRGRCVKLRIALDPYEVHPLLDGEGMDVAQILDESIKPLS